MAEATALTYFIWFFAIFQIAVALRLVQVPSPGPARVAHAVLFLLNGVATFAGGVRLTQPLAGLEVRGQTWPMFLVDATDGPTGLWLILLVPILAHSPHLDALRWTRQVRMLYAATIALTFVHLVTPFAFPRPVDAYIYEWLGIVPLALAYGGLIWVLTGRFLHQTDPKERLLYAFLYIAFGARIIEFAYRYTLGDSPVWTQDRSLVQYVTSYTFYAVAVLVLLSSVRLLLHMFKQPREGRTAHIAVLASMAAVLLYTAGTWGTSDAVVTSIGLLSLVLIRPLFVGLAYEPRPTIRMSGILGIQAGVFVLAKALAAEILGQSFWILGGSDLFGFGAAVLAYAPFLLYGERAADATQPPTSAPTHAERLAQYLLHAHERDPDGQGVTGADIHAAIGITPNNVAGEIRRMERLLLQGEEAERVVDERLLGVRGRKYFRLTEEGLHAAQRLVGGAR